MRLIPLDIEIERYEITRIITSPRLWETQYGQALSTKDFKLDESYQYLGLEEGYQLLGLFQIRMQTHLLIEAHIHLLPKYWGKGYGQEALVTLFEYLKTQTKFTKVITDVPEDCTHVQGLLAKLGCILYGIIPEGVIYNARIQSLLMYYHNLYEIQING